MQKVAEFSGKKVQEAVEAGLKELGIDIDDAEIKIISNGGLFKKAKVAISYDDGKTEEDVAKEEAAKKAEAEKAEQAAAKAKKSNDDEPHWQGAPQKREPSLAPSFGKHEHAEKEEKAEKEEGGEKVAPARKEQRGHASKAEREPRPAKQHQSRPSAEPNEEQIETAKTFLEELLKRMNIEAKVEIKIEDGLRINVDTEDARVIGHRGEVLDALQQLVSTRINNTHGSFVHVSVDGLGYRDRRKETLENLAKRMADKATRTHRKVTLDAMNSADRRIIHAALSENENVFTRSEGHEPTRRVVIIPKRKQA
ncbi:MAG: KH domain-containing protein [Clostridiales bacterium]|nr:KH domain-containing protein [Clostridiales bacterium]